MDLLNLKVEVAVAKFVPEGSHVASIVSLTASEYTPKYNTPAWSDPTKRIDIQYKVDGLGTITSSESYVAYKRFANMSESEKTENVSQAPGREGYAVEHKVDEDGNEYCERIIDLEGTKAAQKRFGYIASVAGIEGGDSSISQMMQDLVDTTVGIVVVAQKGEHSGKSYSQVEDIVPASSIQETAVELDEELAEELAEI